jgi:hypothetical protein
MAGSLSVVTTAVSSAKVSVVDSGEVGRSAVCSRYNSGPRTLPLSKPALTEEFCVLSFNLHKEVSAMQIGFYDKEIIQKE